MEKLQKLKVWLGIAVPILSLLAGSGWGKYLLERRDAKRSEAKQVLVAKRTEAKQALETCLIPLQRILEQNKRVHNSLTKDNDLGNLEHAPDYLQEHFAKLSDGDSRKIAWKALIDIMIKDNRLAINRIQFQCGMISNPDLLTAFQEFVYHAKEWDAVWQSVWSIEPVPNEFKKPGKVIAKTFPKQTDALLKEEIAQWRERAGL